MQPRTPEEFKAAYQHHKQAGNREKAARVAQLYRQQLGQTQEQPQAKDGAFEGFGDAFIRGIDQPLENMGVTAEALGYQDVADSLKGAVDERPGQSASAQFMNADKDGSFAWRYLPKAGVEQAGQFAGSILSRLGGMGLGGLAGSIIPGAGTAGGAMVGGLTGPMLFEAAQQLGPIALERAANNGRKVPNAEDWKYATGTSAGVGALNAIAPGLSGKLKRMLVEGATEGTQSVVEQVGSTVNTKKGLEVDPRQALAEGIIGGTSAGMVDTSVGTVTAATNLVRGTNTDSADMTAPESQAAASYAQRLIKKAEANDYDLKDINTGSEQGARQAVDSTHVDMTEELRQLFNDLKPILSIKDSDSLDAVAEKVLAKVAYRKARNKTKNTVEQEDFAAVEKLTGDTQEGQRALNLMHELNQMTAIHNGGYKGGVSRVTDQLAPLGLGGEGYDLGRSTAEYALRPLISGSAALSTGGGSLAAQLGVVGTGRAIDKVTGRRSRVQRYVDQYGNQQGQPAATGRSVREAKIAEIEEEERLGAEEAARQEQLSAERRDANLQRVQQGAPPQLGSPEDIVRDGTGLDRAEIAKVLRILKANPNTLPGVRRAIDAYEQGIAVGGEMDFSLIRDINAFVDANPNYVQRSRQPNIQRAAASAQAGAQQNLSQRDINYQRGIEDNRRFVNGLKEQLNADKSVRPIEKAKLLDALNTMAYDLGADPVATLEAQAQRLDDSGVDQQAVQKYFVPYVDRVIAQQQAAQKKRQLDIRDNQVIYESQAAMDDSREPQSVREDLDRTAQTSTLDDDMDPHDRITAYHISPYNFDKFSAKEIGKGTGSQVHGLGLYFSQDEGAARHFHNKLHTKIDNDKTRMYEVNINASPNELLDYDLPIKDQTDYVKKALETSGLLKDMMDFGDFRQSDIESGLMVGRHILPKGRNPDTKKLKESGIKGIQFNDDTAQFRGAEANKNYVIFDESLVSIVQKYDMDDSRKPLRVFEEETEGSPEWEAAVAKGLDMSKKGRMKRAKEMGFDTDTVYYHGTSADIKEFDPSKRGKTTEARSARMGYFFTKDIDTANAYAELADEAKHNALVEMIRGMFDEKGSLASDAMRVGDYDTLVKLFPDGREGEIVRQAAESSPNVIPVYLRKGKEKVWDGRGKEYDEIFDDEGGLGAIVKNAKDDNYDSLSIINFDDNPYFGKFPQDHQVIFDPKNIRSVNAAFDPDNADSALLISEPSPADNIAPVLSQSDELPPKDAATETLDNFNIHYQQVATSSIPVGLQNVTTAEEAAHIFAPIRKQAQETVLALVTDSDGKILNLIRHTKGLKNQSLVSPVELIGAVVGTENAANVWFGHNHPSGILSPSMGDKGVDQQLQKALDGTGINAKGHIIVGSGSKVATFFSGVAPHKRIDIKPSVRKRRQELTERVLRRRQQQNILKVKDPSSAKKVIEQISADNALILLDNGLRVLGSLSLTQDEMQNLRKGGQVNRILKAINNTNASSAMVKTTSKDAVSPTEPVKNLARFLNNLGTEGIRLIDWFNNGKSHSETGDIEKILKSTGTFYAHPITTIMAILTTAALQKGEEEEEEEEKMAPGALTPQPALLSA